jgi:dipeptidyl aminopeptidase/acylaminoacyl peptidase
MVVQVLPFGEWKSPITADLIVAGTIGLGSLGIDGDWVYWLETRPQEGGRNVILRSDALGTVEECLPAPFNARTRAHEYGGGSYRVIGGQLYFSNFTDQRLYQINANGDKTPEPVTPLGEWRYADGVWDLRFGRLIVIQEDHTAAGQEETNRLVAIAPDGSCTVLAQGHDFFASPAVSPDGKHLAWITWDHPDMPWDGTELWVAAFTPDGRLETPRKVAGSRTESIFQPEWGPDGKLYFVGDRSLWWNLYRTGAEETVIEAVCPKNAEFGLPQWVFGMSTYGFSRDALVCSYSESGKSRLARIDLQSLEMTEIQTPYSTVGSLEVGEDFVAFLGGSALSPTAVVRLELGSGELRVLRRSSDLEISSGYLSEPQSLEFPTSHGLTAYGLYYPPLNADYQAPSSELPPLLVKSHGGPTAATSSEFNLKIQYWTSRGFAVLDVNYGGSTGYGRAYRERLKGQWGIVDVDDCANGAKFLADQGKVDGDRLVIAGGSAGGYTTLCALTFRDVFKAGASYYGVSDLEGLATDTHKFESRYLDSIIGPYPEAKDLYRARSPIHAVDQLSCPVIFFQGDEDKVVPPNQAELMVDALKLKGLPVAYVLYPGEQHGFRKAENIKRTLDGEFYFYSRVFGFTPAESIEPVLIENLAVR